MKFAATMLCLAVSALLLSMNFPPQVSHYNAGEDAKHNAPPAPKTAAIPVYPLLRHYSAIVSKPLFEPSRVGKVVAHVKVTTKSTSSLLLDGVIQTPESTFALLREKNATKQHKLGVGDALEGWSIKEIQATSITLANGKERMVLRLYDKPDESNQYIAPSIGIGKAVAAREATLPKGAVTCPADMSRLFEAQGRVDSNAEAKRMMDEFEEQINEQSL